MLAVVLFLFLLPQQEITRVEPESFHIERIYVFATYDAAYVLDLANGLLPPDKEVTEADVTCVVNELRSAGLFANIKIEWTESDNKRIRTLTLHCESKAGREAFLMSGIVPMGMPEVSTEQFVKQMAAKEVKAGSSLLHVPLRDLDDKVDEWFRESAPAAAEKKYRETIWITYRPTGPGTFEIRVLPRRPECSVAPARASR